MNPLTHQAATPPTRTTRLAARLDALHAAMARLPYAGLAALARFSLAATFWQSGQTKVEGLALNLIEGRFELGWPRLTASAIDLFRDEYQLPLLPPELAALLAATGEHLLPALLLIGLGTRWAALGLLAMTAVIQLLVYPGAYATHGVWAAALLMLIAQGPGQLSADQLLVWDRR